MLLPMEVKPIIEAYVYFKKVNQNIFQNKLRWSLTFLVSCQFPYLASLKTRSTAFLQSFQMFTRQYAIEHTHWRFQNNGAGQLSSKMRVCNLIWKRINNVCWQLSWMRESGDSSNNVSNTDWNENTQSARGMLVQPPKTKIQTSNKHAAELCLVDCKCVHLHPLWCPSPFPRFRHLQAPAVGLRIDQDGSRMILETEWEFEQEYKIYVKSYIIVKMFKLTFSWHQCIPTPLQILQLQLYPRWAGTPQSKKHHL